MEFSNLESHSVPWPRPVSTRPASDISAGQNPAGHRYRTPAGPPIAIGVRPGPVGFDGLLPPVDRAEFALAPRAPAAGGLAGRLPSTTGRPRGAFQSAGDTQLIP
ncbi:hypothetical protein Bbelb_258890 [Branchiostoma belcheri]|nr:hypothetical protein Bbelb_258890 [Branchiostoma belcheri]